MLAAAITLYSLLFVAVGVAATASSPGWGFQDTGNVYAISLNSKYESDSAVYALGTQENVPLDYFLTKIDKYDGSALWATTHSSPGTAVYNVQPCCIDFNSSTDVFVGGTRNNGEIFVTEFDSGSGEIKWEGKFYRYGLVVSGMAVGHDCVYFLGYSWNIYAGAADDDLYSDSNTKFAGGQIVGDFVLKLDGSSGAPLWMVSVKPLAGPSFQSGMFRTISIADNGNITISGVYFDNIKWTELSVTQTLDPRNGTLLSESLSDFVVQKYESSLSITSGSDYYFASYAGSHVFGTSGITYGYFVEKNHCPDGFHWEPSSATSSICSPCPGFSWSIYKEDENDDITPIYDVYKPVARRSESKKGPSSCPYYFVRLHSRGALSIFVILFLLASAVAYGSDVNIVNAVSISLCTLSMASDWVYLGTVVWNSGNLFSLAVFFIFFPMGHFLYEIWADRRHYKFRQMCDIDIFLPKAVPIIKLSNREHVPYWGETRFMPGSLSAPSEDYFILGFCWFIALLLQLVYGFVAVVYYTVWLSPWLLLHSPYYCVVLLFGYILYLTGVLPYGKTKSRLCFLIWKIPKDVESGGIDDDDNSQRTLHRVNWEVEIASIAVLIGSMIPEMVLQAVNNKRMSHHYLVSILSWISKGLFTLNLINRTHVLYGSAFFSMVLSGFNQTRMYLFSSVNQSEDSDGVLMTSMSSSTAASAMRQRIFELESQVADLQRQLSAYRADPTNAVHNEQSAAEIIHSPMGDEDEVVVDLQSVDPPSY
jgi:hypothetical protein